MENIFNLNRVPLKIDKPIRLIELFAGIGSQAKALERLGANFEHYRVCEFDKYAIASYNAVHGTDFKTSDITKITAHDLGISDTEQYCYIMTYSFPCQDLSLAGKGNGMAKGSGTRSGLLWEVERLLNECSELPQILLMENVTQVHGKKNKEHFDEWINFLESKGYSNYWQDLNAKNFGIPQNRNRTFMVSVLGEYKYEFPQEFPLELRLKDMLEDAVDEQNGYIRNDGTVGTLTTDGSSPKHNNRVIENCYVSEKGVRFICSPKRGMTTDVNAEICQPLTANGQANWTGSFVSPDIKNLEKSSTIGSTEPTKINLKSGETVTSNDNLSRLRIRKLTPKECWRLMGFDDDDFEKASAVNSNTQLYKQAGNSIVVDVLYYVFKNMGGVFK